MDEGFSLRCGYDGVDDDERYLQDFLTAFDCFMLIEEEMLCDSVNKLFKMFALQTRRVRCIYKQGGSECVYL